MLASAILFCSMVGVDAAAIQALTQVSVESRLHQDEYGGVLYEKDGEVCATAPNHGSGNEVEIHALLPKGAKLVGLYHTHPGHGNISEQFSEKDIDAAKQLKVPSFILVTHTNNVRRFTPGHDLIYTVERYNGGGAEPYHTSFGTVVILGHKIDLNQE